MNDIGRPDTLETVKRWAAEHGRNTEWVGDDKRILYVGVRHGTAYVPVELRATEAFVSAVVYEIDRLPDDALRESALGLIATINLRFGMAKFGADIHSGEIRCQAVLRIPPLGIDSFTIETLLTEVEHGLDTWASANAEFIRNLEELASAELASE